MEKFQSICSKQKIKLKENAIILKAFTKKIINNNFTKDALFDSQKKIVLNQELVKKKDESQTYSEPDKVTDNLENILSGYSSRELLSGCSSRELNEKLNEIKINIFLQDIELKEYTKHLTEIAQQINEGIELAPKDQEVIALKKDLDNKNHLIDILLKQIEDLKEEKHLKLVKENDNQDNSNLTNFFDMIPHDQEQFGDNILMGQDWNTSFQK